MSSTAVQAMSTVSVHAKVPASAEVVMVGGVVSGAVVPGEPISVPSSDARAPSTPNMLGVNVPVLSSNVAPLAGAAPKVTPTT